MSTFRPLSGGVREVKRTLNVVYTMDNSTLEMRRALLQRYDRCRVHPVFGRRYDFETSALVFVDILVLKEMRDVAKYMAYTS